MTATRHPNLLRFTDGLQRAAEMGDETAKMLIEGAGPGHPYPCRCALCLEWWATLGPEHVNGIPTWGPFTAKEIREYKAGDHDPPDG